MHLHASKAATAGSSPAAEQAPKARPVMATPCTTQENSLHHPSLSDNSCTAGRWPAVAAAAVPVYALPCCLDHHSTPVHMYISAQRQQLAGCSCNEPLPQAALSVPCSCSWVCQLRLKPVRLAERNC
jgi:hypothetical protein